MVSKSPADKATNTECPVGEVQCQFLDELIKLREEVEELSTLVRTDPLTELSNFRHFTQSLEMEMERTRRTAYPTSVIMLDLDYFKKINDTWGHDLGNKVLVQTAVLIRQTVRKLDIPCRYGGEEFVIILPNTDLPAAIGLAERLRFSIDQ